jgi:hypothetical protein
MCGARAWTDETNGAWGERNFRPAGGGSVLTGSGRVGGPEGWTSRGGGAGEREGEREGGLAWRGAARRRGIGAAARCHTTVESGGVDATRSMWVTGGPRRDGGPIVSGWVQRGEAVGAALTGGVG